jgi:hypothetical protein
LIATSPASRSSAPTVIAALWLDTLHRICGRSAHELKGVLNGVSVNLEVVRSRSCKPDAPASAVATYATAASNQFDAVMDMTEALLALTREGKGPVDIGGTTRRFEALLGPAARADGGSLSIDGSLEELGTSAAPATAVRLAIGASLLAAVNASQTATCRASAHRLVIECGEGASAMPADEIVAALKDADIDIQAEPSAISISFPK